MSTSAKTLIAAPVIYNELKDAEEKAIAVLGLFRRCNSTCFWRFEV